MDINLSVAEHLRKEFSLDNFAGGTDQFEDNFIL